MDFVYFANLISIFVVNILFFFAGLCLNSLVIVSFWRCVQLRKKLCYFMIMVLSSCDLLVVLTNHPVTALLTMLWMTEKINKHPEWTRILLHLPQIAIGFSLLALFVMNFDRYLATYYPIFHRTSVTKGKLLMLLLFLIIIVITAMAMSINNLVIPFQIALLIFFIIYIPPMLFINYKLFTVARKSRRNTGILRGMRQSFSIRNISSCTLAVACLIGSSIPILIYNGLTLTSKDKEKAYALDNFPLVGYWARTAPSLNSTFNCLIFYWKNKTLRNEGMKVIKSIKVCRRVQSRPAQLEQADEHGT